VSPRARRGSVPNFSGPQLYVQLRVQSSLLLLPCRSATCPDTSALMVKLSSASDLLPRLEGIAAERVAPSAMAGRAGAGLTATTRRVLLGPRRSCPRLRSPLCGSGAGPVGAELTALR